MSDNCNLTRIQMSYPETMHLNFLCLAPTIKPIWKPQPCLFAQGVFTSTTAQLHKPHDISGGIFGQSLIGDKTSLKNTGALWWGAMSVWLYAAYLLDDRFASYFNELEICHDWKWNSNSVESITTSNPAFIYRTSPPSVSHQQKQNGSSHWPTNDWGHVVKKVGKMTKWWPITTPQHFLRWTSQKQYSSISVALLPQSNRSGNHIPIFLSKVSWSSTKSKFHKPHDISGIIFGHSLLGDKTSFKNNAALWWGARNRWLHPDHH